MLAALANWIEANVPAVAALDGPVRVHIGDTEPGTNSAHVVISRNDDDPHNTLAGVGGFNAAEIDIESKAETPEAAEALAAAIEAVLDAADESPMGAGTFSAAILNDRSDSHEKPQPGEHITRYVSTREFTIQYR